MQVMLRVGSSASFCDNLHAGGFITAIKGGYLSTKRVNQWGTVSDQHRAGEKFYRIEEIVQVAIDIAQFDMFNRQLFFDFCIDDKNQIRLLEVNLTSFPTIQLICGPAFAEYTDEVINYCRNNMGYISRVIPVQRLAHV